VQWRGLISREVLQSNLSDRESRSPWIFIFINTKDLPLQSEPSKQIVTFTQMHGHRSTWVQSVYFCAKEVETEYFGVCCSSGREEDQPCVNTIRVARMQNYLLRAHRINQNCCLTALYTLRGVERFCGNSLPLGIPHDK
jgi:hypothetical protein